MLSLTNCLSPHGQETGGYETAGVASEEVIIQPQKRGGLILLQMPFITGSPLWQFTWQSLKK
jgi:hypothetical protein